MLTEEQGKIINQIRGKLKHGDKAVIAEKLKKHCSASEVYAVLKGSYYKDLVIETALDVIAKRMKEEDKKISSRVKQKAAALDA